MLNLDTSTWQPVRFGDVVRNVNENVRDLEGSGIERVIALEHLDPGEITISRYGDAREETTFTRRVRPGQTLFGKRRAYQRKAAYSEVDAICSGDILVFEALPERLSPRLLPFLVHSEPFYDHALGTSAGSLSPRTSWKALATYEFSLPPLDEQERIADLLWAAGDYASAQARLLRQAGETQTSAVDGLIKDCGGQPVVLGDVLDVVRGGSPRPIQSYLTTSRAGLNWIKIGDVPPDGKYITSTAQKILPTGLSKTRQVYPGDFILSNSMSFGRPYILQIEGCIHDGWLRLSDTRGIWDTEFPYHLLRSESVQAQFREGAGGSTVKNLNSEIVRRVRVNLPTRQAQVETVGVISKVESVRSRAESSLCSTDALRARLLRELWRS